MALDASSPRCAVCERHAVLASRRKSDDLLPLCMLCGASHIHLGCIVRLETNMHGYLRCANPQCHRLFSEHYNHADIGIKQLTRYNVLYRLVPVLWLLGSAASCAYFFLFQACSERAISNACNIAAWGAEVTAVVCFIAAFFCKVHAPAIYLKLSGSKIKAKHRLIGEFMLAAVSSIFGVLGPVLTLSTLFQQNVWLAMWIFLFHGFVLPTMLWKVTQHRIRMQREIETMQVSLDAVSIADLRLPRAQFWTNK